MEILGVFGGLLGLIMIIGVGIGIFLILRFFWLWYWKINDIVALLEGIDSKLLVLKNNTTGDAVIEDNNDISKPKDHWKQYQKSKDEDSTS